MANSLPMDDEAKARAFSGSKPVAKDKPSKKKAKSESKKED